MRFFKMVFSVTESEEARGAEVVVPRERDLQGRERLQLAPEIGEQAGEPNPSQILRNFPEARRRQHAMGSGARIDVQLRPPGWLLRDSAYVQKTKFALHRLLGCSSTGR
jgi:hypothetical protein